MTSTGDDKLSRTPIQDRLLLWLANMSLLYPLFVILALHTEWLLAWRVLGHRPRVNFDDPKYIDGMSAIHDVVALALLGLVPFFFVALALNIFHVERARLRPALAMFRVWVLVPIWLGAVMFLIWNPFDVLGWWLD